MESPPKEAVDPTIEYNLDEGIHICFGPGATVLRLDLGDINQEESEVKTVTISGLPTAVTERDVEARLSPYGMLLHLSRNSVKNDKH